MTPLQSYSDWKHCITKLCDIPLTRAFVARRLEELRDKNNQNTLKFVESWGEAHRQQVVAWFEQADAELLNEAGR